MQTQNIVSSRSHNQSNKPGHAARRNRHQQQQLDLADGNTPTARSKTGKPRHNGWYLSNNVRLLRSLKRLTQAELAGKVNVSRQTISRIERSQGEPVASLAIAIAEAIDKPVEEVFTVKPYPAAPWRPNPWVDTERDKQRWRRMLLPMQSQAFYRRRAAIR